MKFFLVVDHFLKGRDIPACLQDGQNRRVAIQNCMIALHISEDRFGVHDSEIWKRVAAIFKPLLHITDAISFPSMK